MDLTKRLLTRLLLAGPLCGLVGPALPVPAAPAQPDWLITSDGAYIVHLSAGVAWPRCVEGMRWNGRACEGQALRLEHAAAMALAKTRAKADGVAWRLPHMKELQGLVRQNTHLSNPQSRVPPDGLPAWCWTSTASIDTTSINEYAYGNVMRGVTAQNAVQARFLHAWAVDLATGKARPDMLKRSPQLVRLVRPLE